MVSLVGRATRMRRVSDEGLFELEVPEPTQPKDYRVYVYPGHLAYDAYTYLPTWGEIDIHLFTRGVHYKLYEKMGARVCVHDGVAGVAF